MTVLIIVMLALAAMIFVFAPSKRRKRMAEWRGTAFAHRGLHGDGACENTMQAFERACEAGFGIELDVQLSSDGEVVVFHDDDLKRLLDDERRVDSIAFPELQAMQLPYGGRIPALKEVLELVNGRVPLLVELKNGKRNVELCQKTIKMLRDYRGRYMIESFNPLIVRWFRRNARKVLRGQLVTEMKGYMPAFGRGTAWLLASLALNFLARPDFVAYDVDCNFAAPRMQKLLFGTPMACWTVKTCERWNRAVEKGEMPIFEGFVPETKEKGRGSF